jgi:ribonuclease HII
MSYLIGTDEAGYGPNLGPLLVAATVWKVPHQPHDVDLYQALNKAVCSAPDNRADTRLVIADSKQVYKSGNGLDALERGVLAALLNVNVSVQFESAKIWSALESQHEQHRTTVPWPVDVAAQLPLAASLADVKSAAEKLRDNCAADKVAILKMRAKAIYPDEFNTLTDQLGTKGELLSRATLQLVADLIAELEPAEPVLILCDKHGGRKCYGGLLQDIFSEHFVEVLGETQTESRYRWGPPEHRTEIRFRVGGEAFLPVALASMTAKYLRELSMRAFNDFWRQHVPNLRPTAGYPVDAKRFKAEIATAQRQLKIADQVLWRKR